MTNILPLKIHGLEKSFGDKEVLKNIKLSIQKGEIFGLVGLNGAGKTTMIKIILDLLDADSGEVELFGVTSALKESRKNISYLPEKFQPSGFLKGTEFLSLFHGKKEKLNIEEAKEMASSLALDPTVLSHRVSKYSKGMTQKLGLMSAFLSKAPLVILDEPMSGLDPRARIQLKDQLLKYKEEGNTVFFSSHILADIDEICDRIAILHNGEIQFVGNPEEFKKEQKEKTLERAFIKKIGE